MSGFKHARDRNQIGQLHIDRPHEQVLRSVRFRQAQTTNTAPGLPPRGFLFARLVQSTEEPEVESPPLGTLSPSVSAVPCETTGGYLSARAAKTGDEIQSGNNHMDRRQHDGDGLDRQH